MKLGIIIDNFSIFVQDNPTVSKVTPVHNNPNPPYYCCHGNSTIVVMVTVLYYSHHTCHIAVLKKMAVFQGNVYILNKILMPCIPASTKQGNLLVAMVTMFIYCNGNYAYLM